MKRKVKNDFSIEDFDNRDLNENEDNKKDINFEYLNFRKKKKIKQTVHFNQNAFKIRKESSNSIASNELLLDNQPTNTIALNTNSNLIQPKRSKEDNIIKTNKEGVELTGAEFILLDKLGNEIKVILKDEETKTYRIATGNEIGVNIKVGKATIEGLDKDSYKLKEVVSPEGYNKLTSPVEFSVNGKTNDTIERTRVNVINYTGSELPETGGIGTKLFITSGLSLVLICGLVLVTKLRLYKNI